MPNNTTQTPEINKSNPLVKLARDNDHKDLFVRPTNGSKNLPNLV